MYVRPAHVRTVNDQYTPPEVTQHTEHTVGPIVVNLVPLNDPAQISSAADPMEQDAHELLTDPSRPAEPPAATRITTQNADTPMANTPSCPVLTRVPRLPDIRDFFAPAAPTPPQDEHAKAPQEDQMGEQRDEPSSPPHSNAHGEQEIDSSRCVPELERPHVDYDQRQAQCLKVMTQNIRGLHTGLEDIQTILREHQPDILIVTETKLTKKGRSRISQQLAGQGYRQRHSVRYQLKPQAGVTLLIKKSFDELGDISDISTPDHLTGYMRGVQISLPGCTPLDIVGVYMPTTHPDDKHTRADIYDTAAHLAENASDKSQGTHNLLIAGDFNATLTRSDRASGNYNSMDCFHREHIRKGKLYSLDPPKLHRPRAYTWRKGAAEQPASRIDDMFTNNKTVLKGATSRVWDMSGTDTDHDLLEICIPYSNLNMRPPPPELDGASLEPDKQNIKQLRKLTNEERNTLRIALEEELGGRFYEMNSKLQTLLETTVKPHLAHRSADCNPADLPPTTPLYGAVAAGEVQQEMETLNRDLIDLLLQARDVASLRSHVTHETDMTQSMRLWPLAQHRTRCPEGHGVHGRLSMLRFYNGRLCVRQTEPSSEPVTSDRTVQKEENDMRPCALRQRVCRQPCISINRLMWARARQILISFFSQWDVRSTSAWSLHWFRSDSKQESTGITPFFANYGFHPRTPNTPKPLQHERVPSAVELAETMDSIVKKAKKMLEAAQQRQKAYADKTRRDVQFAVGDKVMLSTKNIKLKTPGTQKLMPKYVGPFEVLQQVGSTSYKLKLPDCMKMHPVFHVSLLQKYREAADGGRYQPPPPAIVFNDEEWCPIDCILKERDVSRGRGRKRQKQYLVRFTGYGSEWDQWCDEQDVTETAITAWR